MAGKLNSQIDWVDNETRIDAARITFSNYGLPEKKDRFHSDPELINLVVKAVSVFDPVEQQKAMNDLYLRLQDDIGVGCINIPWAIGPRRLTWEYFPLAFYPPPCLPYNNPEVAIAVPHAPTW